MANSILKLPHPKSNLAVFFYFLAFSLVFALIVGAPWTDLDSNYYQHMAEHLGGHLFKSNWYPIGMPLMIRIFWTLGLSVMWMSIVANTFRLYLQYLIFRKCLDFGRALVAVALTQGLAWLVLGTMLKAESFFMAAILGIALCFLSESPRVKMWGAWSFFLLALLFRHAGLFLAPAFFLGFWWSQSFRLRRLVPAVVLTVGGMFVTNFVNSGNLRRPSRESFACMHFVAAANTFDYCAKNLSPALCELDANLEYLNKGSLSVNHLNALQFNPDWAPQKLLQAQGHDAVCAQVKQIYSHYLLREPTVFFGQILARAWEHFGPWQSTELGLYAPRVNTPAKVELKERLKKTLTQFNAGRFALRIALLLGLIASVWLVIQKKMPSSAAFLLLASLGHCAGIVLNNPFLVMRYQEVSLLLMLTGFVVAASHWKGSDAKR